MLLARSRMARDPISRLVQLAATRAEVESEVEVAVEAARAQGQSWQSIGDALGITRAAAWERYRDHD